MPHRELPRLLVIGFGGTWCMQQRDERSSTQVSRPLGSDFDFGAEFPQVPRFCEVEFEELAALDSSNLTPRHWTRLAAHVRERGPRFDGVVILQGTDTLAYTAAAMAFALRGLGRPVVLSGAQVAKGALGSDAGNNVVNACRVAALRDDRGGPALARVAVVFGTRIIEGARSRKVSENDFEAFASINAPLLGTIRREIELSPLATQKLKARLSMDEPIAFDEDVALLQLYPGMRPAILDEVASRASGLVLAAFGAGNVPSSTEGFDNPLSLEPAIRRAVERGVPVVVTTQCPHGLAEPGLYETGTRARAAGAIVANDMTTEAALVKLSWLLGRGTRALPALERAMRTPLAFEITPRAR